MYSQIDVGNTVVLVDAEDFERLRVHRWYLDKNGYPSRNVRHSDKWLPRRMHQFVMMVGGDELVDHIDGNKLHCYKENLRRCSTSENAKNGSAHRDSKSRFKGVSWHNQRQKWKARIMVDYKEISLGLYSDETEAARAYDKAAQEHHGQFARLNFPEKNQNAHTKVL